METFVKFLSALALEGKRQEAGGRKQAAPRDVGVRLAEPPPVRRKVASMGRRVQMEGGWVELNYV